MNADYFLDTNVLVYCFDENEPDKREIGRKLVATALRNGSGAISWQVIQEFLNVAMHKWESPMTAQDANEYLRTTLEPLCAVYPSASLWHAALSIQAQSQYRFYDSLIVASALQCGTKILYSEALQSGRKFGEMQIQNPFSRDS